MYLSAINEVIFLSQDDPAGADAASLNQFEKFHQFSSTLETV